MDPFKVGNHSDSLEKGTRPVQSARTRGRRSSVKYALNVFGTVGLTWLLFSYGKRASSRLHYTWPWGDDRVGLSLSADEDLDQCMGSTNWTTHYQQPPWTPDYPYGAETTFSLPLDSDVLYLISRGVSQQGQVNIEQSTQVGDTVDVRVRVAYYDEEALEHATVCYMERTEREHGVGIFTPRRVPHPPHHYDPEDQLLFDVTLTLPAGNGGPLLVKELKTEMPNYSQNIADLQNFVLFDKISLASLTGRLIVQSVTFEVGQFSTLIGKIDGHFNARSSLDLHTRVGLIAPTVNLLHRDGADLSNLTIRTTDGQIEAEVSLTSEALTGGEFEVDAATNSGGIGLKFTHTPVDSVLRCRAESTVGGIEVNLDSGYEGTYSIQTLFGRKLISQHDVEDPAAKGRHRVVSHHVVTGRVEGDVKWVESDGSSSGDEGYVILKTVVSSVKLSL